MRSLFRFVALMLTAIVVMGLAQRRATSELRRAVAPAPSEHDFDFLLGSWTFVADSKNPASPPHYPGHWMALRSGSGTVVEDDYHVVNDSGDVVTYRGHAYQPGETIFLGVTYRAFDAKTKRWTTAFVQPPAAKWSLGTAWRDGDVMREAPSEPASNSRARFYDIEPDHFTWSFDVSKDSGKTWIEDYVIVHAHRTSTTATQ